MKLSKNKLNKLIEDNREIIFDLDNKAFKQSNSQLYRSIFVCKHIVDEFNCCVKIDMHYFCLKYNLDRNIMRKIVVVARNFGLLNYTMHDKHLYHITIVNKDLINVLFDLIKDKFLPDNRKVLALLRLHDIYLEFNE